MSDNNIENSKTVKLVDSLLVRQPYGASEIEWEEHSALLDKVRMTNIWFIDSTKIQDVVVRQRMGRCVFIQEQHPRCNSIKKDIEVNTFIDVCVSTSQLFVKSSVESFDGRICNIGSELCRWVVDC